MVTHYKKTCIATLFFGCILLPMDPPIEKAVAPISIIMLLDRNIQYFSSEIETLKGKITRAQSRSRENLRQQLEGEKSKLQQLLKLNQLFKKQWQDNQNKGFQKYQEFRNANREEKFGQIVDRFNTEMPKVIPSHFQPIDNTTQFTSPEVTPLSIDIDQLAQDTEDRIARRIDTILQNQGDTIVTEASKVTESYMQDINRLTKEIEETKSLLAEKEKSLQQQKKYFPYIICGGVFLAIASALYVTKYFFPQ